MNLCLTGFFYVRQGRNERARVRRGERGGGFTRSRILAWIGALGARPRACSPAGSRAKGRAEKVFSSRSKRRKRRGLFPKREDAARAAAAASTEAGRQPASVALKVKFFFVRPSGARRPEASGRAPNGAVRPTRAESREDVRTLSEQEGSGAPNFEISSAAPARIGLSALSSALKGPFGVPSACPTDDSGSSPVLRVRALRPPPVCSEAVPPFSDPCARKADRPEASSCERFRRIQASA